MKKYTPADLEIGIGNETLDAKLWDQWCSDKSTLSIFGWNGYLKKKLWDKTILFTPDSDFCFLPKNLFEEPE